MNIKDSVGTVFAHACQDRLSSSIGKGISKHEMQKSASQPHLYAVWAPPCRSFSPTFTL